MSATQSIGPQLHAVPSDSPATQRSGKNSSLDPKEAAQLQQACRDFEEIFLRMLLKEAKVDQGMISGKGASPLYGDLIRENLAKALSKGGGIGLAETLYRQFSMKGADHHDTEFIKPAISDQTEGRK